MTADLRFDSLMLSCILPFLSAHLNYVQETINQLQGEGGDYAPLIPMRVRLWGNPPKRNE
jgi:hypothetical protein